MKVVINYLRRLQNGADPKNVEDGICFNLSRKMFKCLEDINSISVFISEYSEDWPRFSGDRCYPVPADDGTGCAWAYWHNEDKNLWIGKYGEDRRDLCGHIADRLEAEL